jgi:hypothetical protein
LYDDLLIINSFSKLLRQIPADYKGIGDEIRAAEKELLDIRHEIELTKLTRDQRSSMCLKQQKVLLHRRQLKNQQEFMRPMVDLLGKMPNLEGTLSKILITMESIKDNQESRVYRCRTEDKVI